jgi:predicted small lipoprotein YifL
MKRRSHFNVFIAATLIAGFTLSACGIRGELKTPPPVWGEDIRTPEQKAEAAKKDGKPQSIITNLTPEPSE